MILGQPTQFWPTEKQVTGIGNLKHLQVSNNSTITRIRHDEISPFDDTSLFKTPVDQNIGPINNAFFLTATALSLEDALSFHKHVRCHRDKTSVLQMCILPCFTMFYPSTFNVGETKHLSIFVPLRVPRLLKLFAADRFIAAELLFCWISTHSFRHKLDLYEILICSGYMTFYL